MKTLYKWFKTLLVERPNLINSRAKFFNVCCIYLNLVSPGDSNDITFFDEFISLGSIGSYKKSSTLKSKIFGTLDNYTHESSDQDYSDSLVLQKFQKGGRMDPESFDSWIKVFLVLYTDTFRDLVTFIADEDTKSGLDFLAISELSEIFKVEGDTIVKGWIELNKLTKISRSSRSEDREFIHYIHLMEASRDYIDPFSYDRYFSRKLIGMIESMEGRFPNSISSFPNSISGKLAENVLEQIKLNAERTIENYISIVKASRFEVHRDFSRVQRVTPFNTEVQESIFYTEDKVRNPYRRRKDKYKDYDQDWSKPCSREENFILYFIYFYISKLVDMFFYEKEQREEFRYPRTNIRFMAKPANSIFIVVMIVILYYLLFIR